ncbi:MAG: hypothetical protein K5663_06835 [Clostridiales bacterium]|nr:hypothetical protein [Clostridiales bacterium]
MANEGNISLRSEASATEWIAKANALNASAADAIKGVSTALNLITQESEGTLVDVFKEAVNNIISWTDEVVDGVGTIVNGIKKTYDALKKGYDTVTGWIKKIIG